MTLPIWDPAEREEVRLAAIARYVAREIHQEELRVELARCRLTATEIDQVVNDHRKARRMGTPFA
jgi:hypothetical protein